MAVKKSTRKTAASRKPKAATRKPRMPETDRERKALAARILKMRKAGSPWPDIVKATGVPGSLTGRKLLREYTSNGESVIGANGPSNGTTKKAKKPVAKKASAKKGTTSARSAAAKKAAATKRKRATVTTTGRGGSRNSKVTTRHVDPKTLRPKASRARGGRKTVKA